MARANPVHSGYTIQHGAGTGTYGFRIDVWVEYYIGAPNIEANTTPFTAYFYAALNPSYTSSTTHQNGLNSTFSVDGSVVSRITAGPYDFRSPNTLNLLGSYSGDVAHNNDGTRSIKISGSFTTKSDYIAGGNVPEFTIQLPTIPRASTIDSASNVTLGNNCTVRFTPKAASMRYKLDFLCGSWVASSGLIHPNTTNQYSYTGINLPLDIAWQFSGSKTQMKVVLYTYTDSAGTNQIGMDDGYFNIYVPDNQHTKPSVSLSVAPDTTPISGLYIQGLSTVKASVSATDPYGASINALSVDIGGTNYSSPYTSGYLNTTGTVKVVGHATNSRGFEGTKETNIDVIAYSKPQIKNVSVVRCTANGTQDEAGKYLKISATRSYSKVESGGKQNNYCRIQYRYKAELDSGWSGWATILENGASSDTVTTGALLGSLSAEKVYVVQVGVIDTMDYYADSTITLPTASVFMHRRAGGKAMGLGKYVEEDNLLDVAWNVKLRGTTTVETPVGASDAVNKTYVDQTAICYGEYAISSLNETDAVMTAIVNSIGGYGKRFIMFNYNGQLFGCTVYRGSERYSWAEADSYTRDNAYKMHRVMLAGVWQPWEWENPPMKVDEEYRTTKRHNGKPVYRKAVSVGAMPDSTTRTIPHNIADVDFTFPVSGCMVHNAGNNIVSIPYFESTSNFVGMTMQQTVITITAGGNSSAFNGTLHLEYTKNTD